MKDLSKAKKQTFPNFDFVKTDGGISEFRHKKNGLRVLIKENHTLPIATLMATFHVGSRNEVVGNTGSTHILEHMMFKKTKNYPEYYTNTFTLAGGRENATTWLDRTNYFEIIPIEILEDAVRYEADRMRNLDFTDDDLKREMTVVRNEYERGENSPDEALDKAIWATAFVAHPYHHSTIGWLSDIENVTAKKLHDFYNVYYWPNNATVTVIGDVKTEDFLVLIDKTFGLIPKSPHEIKDIDIVEPEQEGERRVTVSRAGENGIVGLAYKAVGAMNNDVYPLIILGDILTTGRSSRLYKKLVDTNMATSVDVLGFPFRDQGLFTVYANLSDRDGHSKVEKIIEGEIESIKTKGVSDKEVNNAISRNLSHLVFSRDGTYSIASKLNESIACGDWTLFTKMEERLSRVTKEDVRAVAKKYFLEEKRTVGYFIPKQKTKNK